MYMHASKHTCLHHAHSQFNIDKHKTTNNSDKCINVCFACVCMCVCVWCACQLCTCACVGLCMPTLPVHANCAFVHVCACVCVCVCVCSCSKLDTFSLLSGRCEHLLLDPGKQALSTFKVYQKAKKPKGGNIRTVLAEGGCSSMPPLQQQWPSIHALHSVPLEAMDLLE